MKNPPSALSPDGDSRGAPDQARIAPRDPSGHERSDASLRVVGWTAGSLALGVAAALAVGLALFRGHASVRPAAPAAPVDRFQHGPEERTSVEEDRAQLQKQTIAHLSAYGWVDRSAGVVRIPIERAMTLEAEREAGKEKP